MSDQDNPTANIVTPFIPITGIKFCFVKCLFFSKRILVYAHITRNTLCRQKIYYEMRIESTTANLQSFSSRVRRRCPGCC